jgi:signal transduction histidine kinase
MSSLVRPIRWRLAAWSVGVLAVILILFGTTIYVSMARGLMAEVDRSLMLNSQAAQASVEELAETGHVDGLGYHGGTFYLVVAQDGTVLANPQRVAVQDLPAFVFPSDGGQFSTIQLGGQRTRVYTRALQLAGLAPSTLVVGEDLEPEDLTLQRLLLVLLVVGGAALALSLVGGWLLAARALVPIQLAFETQQEFVADASHELRTPLSILHSATDLLDQHSDEPLRANRGLFEDVRREIRHMERLNLDLLTLARADQRQLQLAVGQVQLGALAADLVRRIQPLADERGVTVEADVASPPPVVEADPERLHQVGLILLDNALEHTPRGGRVTLVVRRHAGGALLEVIDTGEGIPNEHLGRIFDRFYRLDRARSRAQGGTGLGLAIARTLVTAHGGQILMSSREGSGTRVSVRLPLMQNVAS